MESSSEISQGPGPLLWSLLWASPGQESGSGLPHLRQSGRALAFCALSRAFGAEQEGTGTDEGGTPALGCLSLPQLLSGVNASVEKGLRMGVGPWIMWLKMLFERRLCFCGCRVSLGQLMMGRGLGSHVIRNDSRDYIETFSTFFFFFKDDSDHWN